MALLVSFDDNLQVENPRYGEYDRWADEEMDVTDNLLSESATEPDEYF